MYRTFVCLVLLFSDCSDCFDRRNISSQDPPVNSCLCTNTELVNIRDQPCGSVTDTASIDQCYSYKGVKTECSLSGNQVQSFELDVSGTSGWIIGDYLAIGADSQCGCNRTYFGRTGSISSPDYPNNYPSDVDCYGYLTIEQSDVVIFDFSDPFWIDDQFDFVEIRLITPGCQWTQGVYTYDGSAVPPPLAIMPCAPNNDTIQVYFHSDLSEEGAGFQMNFTIADCIGYFNDLEGHITSPNYLNNYPAFGNCSYNIDLGQTTTITLEFLDPFWIENLYDSVKIITTAATCLTDSVYSFEGTVAPPPLTLVSCSAVQIQFRSDFSEQGAGFRIKYTAADSSDCPSNFTRIAGYDGESCYQIVLEQLDWLHAGIRCRELVNGSHLVAVEEAAEDYAIVKFLQASFADGKSTPCGFANAAEIYTSGQTNDPTDCNSTHVWKPYPTSAPIPMNYTSWAPGQPDCSGEGQSCVQYWQSETFKWDDNYCGYSVCALCEFEQP